MALPFRPPALREARWLKHPRDWARRLSALEQVDWSRWNTEVWEGRALMNGCVSKANTKCSFFLTANLLKQQVGLELSANEKQLESLLGARQSSGIARIISSACVSQAGDAYPRIAKGVWRHTPKDYLARTYGQWKRKSRSSGSWQEKGIQAFEDDVQGVYLADNRPGL